MERGASDDGGRLGPPPSWIRLGLGIAAGGYAVAAMYGVVALEPVWLHRGPEVGAAVVLAFAYLASDRWPRVASIAALATIWLELTFAVAVGGTRTSALFVFPVLVTGTAFLLGGRAGLVAAVGCAASIPAAAALGVRFAGGHWTGAVDGFRAVVAGMVCAGTGVMAYVALAAHERALVLSERARRRHEVLFASAPDALFVVDEEGRIVGANRAATDLFGEDEEELLGRSLGEAVGPVLEEAAHSEGDPRPAPPRAEVRGRGGALRTVEVTARALPPHDGDGVRTLVVLRDVTDRDLLEERLRDAERLESLGLLAGGVAHDFGNLLAAVGAGATVLGEHADPLVREAAADVREAEERGAALVQQLLAFARSGPVQPEPLDLGAELRAEGRILQGLAGDRHRVVLDVRGAAPVRFDRSQLEQVALNLVANARDALPGGGEIRIAVRPVSTAEARGLGSSLDGANQVVLEVVDGGVGMDDETAARIFDPFFTTKPRGRGTGLGLATVRAAVTRSGGCVAVRTAPGAGSTFRVFLPASPPPGAAPPRS